MSFGIIIAALVLTILSTRYPLFRAIGMFVCLAVIGGILYHVWGFTEGERWFFWALIGIGAVNLSGILLLNKIIS
jgi:hypothetical protein